MSTILELTEEANPPENLKPKTPEEKVQSQSLAVDARRQLDPGQIEEIKNQFGLREWSPGLVNNLSKIGFDCEKVGISRINKGTLMVAQEANLVALQELQKMMSEAKSASMKLRIAGVIAKVTMSLNDTVKASGMDSVATSIVANDKVRRATPAKGAVMRPPSVTVLPDVKVG